DLLNFLTSHGTIQTDFFHTPETKDTCAPHKIASASPPGHPASRARSPERLGINEGDPSGRRRCALSALRSVQRHFEGAYFASDSQRSRGRRSLARDLHGDLEPGEKLLFPKGQTPRLDGDVGPATGD